MHLLWRALLCLSVLMGECIVALKFSSVTSHVRLGEARGKLAGFADFNADKATDVLVRNSAGSNYSIYLWSRDKERFHTHDLHLPNASAVVYTAAVDLDADGQVDLLTLSRETEGEAEGEGEGEGCYTLGVYWMAPQRGGPVVDDYQVIATQVLRPPLVVDTNGDHIPDVMSHSCDSLRATLWTSSGFIREFKAVSLTTHLNYSTSYYIDLTGDNLADVVVDGWGSGGRSLALWQKSPSCSLPTTFLPPALPVPLPLPVRTAPVSSPLTFADMDGDGRTEAVAFSCPDPACSSLHVHILSRESAGSSSTDCTVSSSQSVNFTQVHTVPVPEATIFSPSLLTFSPVLGDVDLDGYPDIIVPASSRSGVLLLVATRCHAHCNGSGVTLEPHWLSVAGGNLTAAAFFDLGEDGVLDVVLAQQVEGEGEKLLAYRHQLQEDHAFLKVLVLSGHCYHDCKSGQEPYGSVLPGAVVRFSTTDRMGRRKRSVRTLTSGHAHQLPFVVFGLGQTPSLVEELEVAVDGGGREASHSWSNMVPNSQVIVIPHPPADPSRWRLELYLTPGELVYNTAGVLAALFLATAVVVLLLHARERFQDTREKRRAKHKFHFNAM